MSRTQVIKLIHIARGQFIKQGVMDDDSYRAMLVRLTGKNSCLEASIPALMRVLSEMQRLGFKTSTKRKDAPLADFPMGRKIWVLWQDLAKVGLVRDKSQKALDAYVLRETGVTKLAWLKMEPDKAHQLIEKLKKWQLRKQ
ncbi:gp16 family protein [Yersinia aldovae]|uniref:gp16 family protein n=1 Tax=Yersinia aldovae TaxID=29483 RepID=UPI0006711F9F|nr:regulatory protein GemA [Yersinia aldovae]